MITDEQLLRDAAFAAGLKIKAVKVDADDNFLALVIGEKHTKQRIQWNPLTDDGDALRLVSKLRLKITPSVVDMFEGVDVQSGMTKVIHTGVYDFDNADDDYVLREAIVRAAAEIGRTKS